MRCFILFLALLVLLANAKAQASNPRKKWSDRVVFPGVPAPSNPTKPNADRPSWHINRPVWDSNRPVWDSNIPVWDSNNPRRDTNNFILDSSWPIWGSFNPDSRNVASKPDTSNNIEPEPEKHVCVPTSSYLTADTMCCGIDAISNQRIVGGNISGIEQHPWLVQIEYNDKTRGVPRRLCGGFLISNKYALSAAHCFSGEILKVGTPENVILGEFDVQNQGPDCLLERGVKKCTEGAISVPIQRYRAHPKYLFDGVRNLNDIAVVRMSRKVQYSKFIRPICLPSSDIATSPAADLRFTTAGWGAVKHMILRNEKTGVRRSKMEYDDFKRHVDVPYVNNTICGEQFTFLTAKHMCAGGEAGKDSCKGDSGGPLMFQRDGVYEAVGLVSTASGKYPCGTANHVGVYTNVYQYLDWIKQQIRP